MKPDPNPVRTLQSNIPWLHLSELRADWEPWSTSVFVSPSCIEVAYQQLPPRQKTNHQSVAAFIRAVVKAVQSSPPRELPDHEVQIGLFEFRTGDESTDVLLGVRANDCGAIYLVAPDDWNEN